MFAYHSFVMQNAKYIVYLGVFFHISHLSGPVCVCRLQGQERGRQTRRCGRDGRQERGCQGHVQARARDGNVQPPREARQKTRRRGRRGDGWEERRCAPAQPLQLS